MPWKATCHMDERMQFIARVLAGEDEMTVLCREYGVSRKTGYKWLGRYISEGAAGLVERLHGRRRCPAYTRPFAAVAAANDGGYRFQGLVSHRRRAALRSVHLERCAQPLPVALSGRGAPRRRACAADLRGGVPRA